MNPSKNKLVQAIRNAQMQNLTNRINRKTGRYNRLQGDYFDQLKKSRALADQGVTYMEAYKKPMATKAKYLDIYDNIGRLEDMQMMMEMGAPKYKARRFVDNRRKPAKVERSMGGSITSAKNYRPSSKGSRRSK
jgi:hypothetical protein